MKEPTIMKNTKKRPAVYSCIFCLLILCFCQGAFSADNTRGLQKAAKKYYRQASYTIGRGDILDIVTWKEPDFSREEILVRIDGKITFPLLNDIQAAGRTPMQLKKDIEIRLKSYIETPVVTVSVRIPGSQKIYILGEVVQTGEYNLTKNLTILQAFALAGGFTEWAAKNEIILFRKEGTKDQVIRVKYKDIIKGKDFSQNIQLKADDTIIVP